MVYPLHFFCDFSLIFIVFINIRKSKSGCLCVLPRGFKKLSYQLFDTNFSFLELFVIEIVAVLLVYPLHLQVIFLLYLKFFSIFEKQESQLVYILVAWL